MTDENIPSIVLGEASESDEDDYLQENIVIIDYSYILII